MISTFIVYDSLMLKNFPLGKTKALKFFTFSIPKLKATTTYSQCVALHNFGIVIHLINQAIRNTPILYAKFILRTMNHEDKL